MYCATVLKKAFRADSAPCPSQEDNQNPPDLSSLYIRELGLNCALKKKSLLTLPVLLFLSSISCCFSIALASFVCLTFSAAASALPAAAARAIALAASIAAGVLLVIVVAALVSAAT